MTDANANNIGHSERDGAATVSASALAGSHDVVDRAGQDAQVDSDAQARRDGQGSWARLSQRLKGLETTGRPAGLASAFLAFVALVYWLLGIGQGNSDIAHSLEWMTWKALASFAIGIALGSFILGVDAIRKVADDSRTQETPQSPAADRLAGPLQQATQGKLAIYSTAAVALTAATLAFLALGAPETHEWPTDLDATPRTLAVVIVIGMAAIPWLVLVWFVQDRLARYAEHNIVPSTADLRRLWDSLYAIVLAFAVFVVLALVPTGALRAAYFAGAKDPASDKNGPEFPASSVLLYGAFFALLLSAIALPMVAAYRAAARGRVEASHGITDPPDKDQRDSRAFHEELLHLDVGVLRSPITALTVFTPLITAALAAYLPDLAG